MVARVRLQIDDVDVNGRIDAARLRIRIADDFRIRRVGVRCRVAAGHHAIVADVRIEMVVQVV